MFVSRIHFEFTIFFVNSPCFKYLFREFIFFRFISIYSRIHFFAREITLNFFPVREFDMNALFILRIHYLSNIIFANAKWILFLFREFTIVFSHFELYVYGEYRVFIMNLLFLLCFHFDWFFNDYWHDELTFLFAYHRLTLISPSYKIANFYFLKLFRVIVCIFSE